MIGQRKAVNIQSTQKKSADAITADAGTASGVRTIRDQLRTVGFWLCLTGRWRLLSALSIPFSREVSLGEGSWSAALARSLAASMNLSVLSFASNAMALKGSSIKSYTYGTEMSSNQPKPSPVAFQESRTAEGWRVLLLNSCGHHSSVIRAGKTKWQAWVERTHKFVIRADEQRYSEISAWFLEASVISRKNYLKSIK